MYTDFTNNIQSFRLYPILSDYHNPKLCLSISQDYHNQVHLNDTGGYLVRVDIGEGVFVYVRLSIYPQIQSPPINLSIMAVHDNSSQKQYGMDKFKRIRFAHQLLLLFIKCMWGFFLDILLITLHIVWLSLIHNTTL